MEPLRDSAASELAALASRFAVSEAAVQRALGAVVDGGGKMAQFESPELGGSVQWMRGGSAMVSDRDAPLGRDAVGALCDELARLVESQVIFDAPRASSAPRAPDAGQGAPDGHGPHGAARQSWYPEELGVPSASGGQNGMHYAVFPTERRLAVDRVGRIDVYDTLDHHITGVQQEDGGAVFDLSFTSQRGTFRIDSLPRMGPARPERTEADAQPSAASANAPRR